jgi:hypothetical protein
MSPVPPIGRPTREQVMQALFLHLQAIADFKTAGRRLKLWADVPPGDQPAMFLVDHHEKSTPQPRGLPNKLLLRANVFIYFQSGTDQTVTPDTLLNGYLDALDVALAPDNVMDGVFSLGGMVDHCWVEGETLKDPGDLDGQGLIIVPLNILLP